MASTSEGNEGDHVAQEIAPEITANAANGPMEGGSNDPAAASGECVEEAAPMAEDVSTVSTDRVDVVNLSGGNGDASDVGERGSSVKDVSGSVDDLVVEKAVDVDAGAQDDTIGNADMVEVANESDETAEPSIVSGEAEATQQHDAGSGDDAQDADQYQHHHNDEEETDDEDVRYHDDADHDQGVVHDDDADMQHNHDEYDPANPAHNPDGDADDSTDHPESTEHAQDEYDPANPTEGFDTGDDKKANASAEGSPVRKRKLSDTPTVGSMASPTASNASGARSPKRPRGTTALKVDQRGLKNSAWDRLMDFESTREFRIGKVSRAAFSTIAVLPEFAQCAIIARFTRTPMKDIRDKNELILRLCREYLSENPTISSLQPVSVFIDDATADPGLFAYGYAPPMPIGGMSTVKIPLRQDKPGTISTPSAPSAVPVKLPKPAPTEASSTPQLDEFGREIKPSSNPSQGEQDIAKAAAPTPAIAPMTSTQVPTPAAPSSTMAGKPSDPRRRRQGGVEAVSVESTIASTDTRGHIEKSDVYNRLPIRVRSLLDGLIAARRLPEAINDNVLSRLNHLPEATAVTAIEKFMESDLGQIGNVNGFLVGIINRVQERGSTSSDPRNIAPSSQSAHVPGTTYHQHQHPPHQSQRNFSHAPAPQHIYTDASVPHGGPVPVGIPHSFEHAAGSTHFRDHQMQPPMAAAPVGYDAPPAWNPAPAAAPVQYSAQSGPPTGRFSSHHTIDKAIEALPVAIQNHLVSLVNSRILPSLDDLSEKCYEVLGQLSEGLANDVLKRFGAANLISVRNRSAFLMGVVKKCRQEYGFD